MDDKDVVFINEQKSENTTFNYGRLDFSKNLQDFEHLSGYSFKELKIAEIKELFIRKKKE